MTACWLVGVWTFCALRMPGLAAMPLVAWLAGAGVLGLVLLLVGRAGLLRWWTAGVPVLALGAYATIRIAVAARSPARTAWAAIAERRLDTGCAALIVLLAGLASVWTAAPEIMFDAIYAKEWLPSEWARTGEIEPLTVHPVLNITGFAQILAVPGHLAGAEGVGRYLQWLASFLIPASLWSYLAPRTAWAPLAAAAVAVTPHLFWQASTAFDDALLALAALALAQAVVRCLEHPEPAPAWEGAALGLLAGTCVNLKLHLGWLAAALLLGYLLLRRHGRMSALAGIAAGGLLSAGPPMIQRWIDVGNPVLPAYNNVFHSPYWPGVNERFNFPYLADPGALGPLDALWRAVTDTGALNEAAPVGAFGLLVVALSAALALGLVLLARRPCAAPLLVLWGGLMIGTLTWYAQFRYLRYVMPLGVIAVLMIALAGRAGPLSVGRQRVGLGALALVAALLWPATVAQFWNVPGRDIPWEAALGITNDRDYERQSMPEREALAVFDAEAAPRAMAVSPAHQRAWLSGGRDLEPEWELDARLQIGGAERPSTPDEALRRMRALGVSWALTRDASPRQPYLDAVIARHGELRWADAGFTLYRFVDRPPAPTSMPACDDRLEGRPGCWEGTLDDQPGYRAEESPGGIARAVPACAGETVTVDVTTKGGDAPLGVAIDFDGPDPARGHMRPLVGPDATARAAGTAPPGATLARIALLAPPPGMTVTEARLGRTGAPCGD